MFAALTSVAAGNAVAAGAAGNAGNAGNAVTSGAAVNAVAAVATPAVTPARAAGLVEAWHAARDHDPDIGVSRAARAVGQARAAQAGTLWGPQVSLSATAGIGRGDTAVDGARFTAPGFGAADGATFRTSVDGVSGRIAIGARQPIWSADLSSRSRQLVLSGEAAELEWRAAEQEAMLRTAERWLEVSLAVEALQVTRAQRRSVERALAEATDRYRMGDTPVTGTHEARARAEAVRAQVLAVETELAVREAALEDTTGLPRASMAVGVARARDVAEPAPAPLERWLDDAASANPAIRVQQIAVQVALAEASRTARPLSPSVDLVAQAGRDRISGNGDFGPSSSAATNALVGVQISLPLYTGGARDARHEEALRNVDRAGAELERARRGVARQVRAAWLGLNAGAGRIVALEQALVASRARLDATRTGQEVGDRTTLDLLNAENDAAQAALTLAQARIALMVDRLRLAALAGRLDEA
jgi:outer membrane protein